MTQVRNWVHCYASRFLRRPILLGTTEEVGVAAVGAKVEHLVAGGSAHGRRALVGEQRVGSGLPCGCSMARARQWRL
jgi:hypothetical protein